MARAPLLYALVSVVGLLATAAFAAMTPLTWDLNRMNTDRADAHVRLLHHNDRLAYRARRWALHMASTGMILDDVAGERACWAAGGSVYAANVGFGRGVTYIERAFEHSPQHDANIMDASFRLVGIASAPGNGGTYLTQEFCG